MPVPKCITMRTNDDGTKEQFFAVTHADAVMGLNEAIGSRSLTVGVTSINGHSGDITLPVINQSDYVRIMAMVEAFEKGEINGGVGTITTEKVGEI